MYRETRDAALLSRRVDVCYPSLLHERDYTVHAGETAIIDINDMHRLNAWPLFAALNEMSQQRRRNLPEAEELPSGDLLWDPAWDAYESNLSWPLVPENAVIGDTVLALMIGPTPPPHIQVCGNLRLLIPNINVTHGTLLSHMVLKFQLTPDKPFGNMGQEPLGWETFTYSANVRTGNQGHYDRFGLFDQKGLRYVGDEAIEPGTPLMAYTGVLMKADSDAARAADARGRTFELSWPYGAGPLSYVIVPDDRNWAQWANDASKNLNAQRNHVAALHVNAVFVTIAICGVPVPVLVSRLRILPGQQVVTDYGKGFKPGAV
jgi:hypothetical protein